MSGFSGLFCLLQPRLSILVLLLEADLVIQCTGNKVGGECVFGHARLTCLPIQKVVRGAGESLFLSLVTWGILWMLEVNESVAKVWLGGESCCFFQC